MNKLLVVCGPTATGKTALGIKLAKKFSGELVSADSRQVYQGMDIGTGKEVNNQINKFQMTNQFQISNNKYEIGYYLLDRVKIWLYDIVEPDEKFSVADYIRCAKVVIGDIWQRSVLPILVGGAGFYIKGLIDGYETLGTPPDWKLRKQLGSWTAKQLGDYLRKIDRQRWERINQSDRNNPRRLIRRIEVVMRMQNSKFKIQNCNAKFKIKDILIIGLKTDYRNLYQRIDKRVEARIKQGIREEIQSLLKKGYSWNNSVLNSTIGYREWRDYIENSKLGEKAIQKWKFAEHAYARRQMSWFKRDSRINWFDITKKSWQDRVEKLVKNWYSKK